MFVDHYAILGNGSEAARLAGYSAKTACAIASETLRIPHVIAAVRERQAQHAAELNVTKADVIAGILGAIALARQQADPGAMIAGCTALAKLCGFFAPEVAKVEAGGAAVVSRLASLSDAELIEMAGGASAARL